MRRPPLRPSVPAPASLASLSPAGGVGGRPGRTLRAVELTQRDLVDLLVEGLAGELVNLFSGGGPKKVRSGGLRAGGFAYSLKTDTLVLKGFSYVPGVRVSGRVRRLIKRASGRLRVHGPAAASGTLVMRGATLSGRLGGRTVRLRLARAERVSAAASAAKADQFRRPHPPIR